MSYNMMWEPYHKTSIWQGFLDSSSAPSFEAFCDYFNKKLKSKQSKQLFLDNELNQLREYTHSLQNHQSSVSWGLYYFLCFAGGAYALCSGFDGMASILALVMPELYVGLLIALGIISALSALGIFIARDKPSIMDTIELSYNPYHSLVDEYLFSIHIYNDASISEKLKKHQQDFGMERVAAGLLDNIFKDKAKINQEIKEKWWVQIQANIMMAIGGILFFSDGFFVGENVAVLISSMLGVNSFEWVLFTSLVMACFALVAYWYVERSSLKTYLYDNVSTDDNLLQERKQVNDKNLIFLNFFQAKSEGFGVKEGQDNYLHTTQLSKISNSF